MVRLPNKLSMITLGWMLDMCNIMYMALFLHHAVKTCVWVEAFLNEILTSALTGSEWLHLSPSHVTSGQRDLETRLTSWLSRYHIQSGRCGGGGSPCPCLKWNPSSPLVRYSRINVLKLKLKLIYDRQSVGQSVLVSGAHLGPASNFSFAMKFP
jgi:hypothetical protein